MLEEIFKPDLVKISLESTDKDELFEEMVEIFVRSDPSVDREKTLSALLAREEKMTTGILPGIAIPHACSPSLKGVRGAIGISKEGIEYHSLDDHKVHLVFMLIFGCDDTGFHLKAMQEIALLLQDPAFFPQIMEQTSAEDVLNTIRIFEESLL